MCRQAEYKVFSIFWKISKFLLCLLNKAMQNIFQTYKHICNCPTNLSSSQGVGMASWNGICLEKLRVDKMASKFLYSVHTLLFKINFVLSSHLRLCIAGSRLGLSD
jgi:hypothetical protein